VNALTAARAAQPSGREHPVEERAAVLERVAQTHARDKARFPRSKSFEAERIGPRPTGDVAEAIDFLQNFYAAVIARTRAAATARKRPGRIEFPALVAARALASSSRREFSPPRFHRRTTPPSSRGTRLS